MTYIRNVNVSRLGRTPPYFLGIAIIYFFFNSTLLPHGLLYTTILAPFFYFWLLLKKEQWVATRYLLIAAPFFTFSIFFNSAADIHVAIQSFTLYFLIYITVYAAAHVVSHDSRQRIVFIRLIRLNFFFCIFAVGALWTPLADVLWSYATVTAGVSEYPRLKLLTYEPSYYSTLLVPLAAYSVTCLMYQIGDNRYRNFLYILIPLVFSFSFGVLSGLLIAISIATFFKLRTIQFGYILGAVVLLALASIFFMLNPDNIAVVRLTNILLGTDSSGAVRTTQSNWVAWQIMDTTSIFWGAGFGQAKLFATSFFDEYWLGLDINRITNAVAGTAAEFGVFGLLLRFFLEFLLFFRTKVYNSHFRFTLFLFAFIYQFTGSFTTNVAEYIIWLYAFIPAFQEMENSTSRFRKSA